jgi:DNA recombination protein RmuC
VPGAVPRLSLGGPAGPQSCYIPGLPSSDGSQKRSPGVAVLVGLIVGFVLGALLVGVAAVLVRRLKAGEDLLAHERQLDSLHGQLARLEAELEGEKNLLEQREVAWNDAREAMLGEFATLSSSALRQNGEQFLQLASQRLDTVQQAAKTELDHRNETLEQMLRPFKEQLGRYESMARDIESSRQHAYAGLTQQVKQLGESQIRLQQETRNLVTALRSPATRGRWGEQQLRRLMELAGMIEHCDFDEQVTTESENGRVRPDVVVHLSGGRSLIVDSKVPLQAFLDASDATDEADRKGHLVSHARQLRSHIDSLSKKKYSQDFECTPDFVIAFIPGDVLLSTAMEHDPNLLEHSFERRVILATPTSLIALMRTIAFSWQQESLAENALEIQKVGRELYKRLATFGDHLAKAGKRLGGAVDAYNDAIGSLERNVLPQARRFHDLGVGTSDRTMAEPDPIHSLPRLVQAPELTESSIAPSDDAAQQTVADNDGQLRMLPIPGDGLRARSS